MNRFVHCSMPSMVIDTLMAKLLLDGLPTVQRFQSFLLQTRVRVTETVQLPHVNQRNARFPLKRRQYSLTSSTRPWSVILFLLCSSFPNHASNAPSFKRQYRVGRSTTLWVWSGARVPFHPKFPTKTDVARLYESQRWIPKSFGIDLLTPSFFISLNTGKL